MPESRPSFHPLVSIIIPVYKGEDFMAEAIDSALAQTYPNLEVVVINDGSPDGGATERVARSYGDKIRYFHKPNGGVATALSAGIEHMKGEYFSWLSHDDLYLPEKVAKQVEFLATLSEEERARSVVYSDFSIFTTDAAQDVKVTVDGPVPEHFRYWLTTKSALHGCTLLIPKAAFAQVGTFNPELRHTQDYDLWFRMAQHFDFRYLPGKLVKGRQHAGQDSVALSGFAKVECTEMFLNHMRALTAEELTRGSGASVAEAYAQLARSLWYRGYSKAAWNATERAVKAAMTAPVAQKLAVLRLLVSCAFVRFCLQPLRPYLAPCLRRKIRNALGRAKHAVKLALPEVIRCRVCRSELP